MTSSFAAVIKKGFRIPASGVGKETEDGKEGIRESGFGKDSKKSGRRIPPHL
jgi:hypothetical protein